MTPRRYGKLVITRVRDVGGQDLGNPWEAAGGGKWSGIGGSRLWGDKESEDL